MNPMLPAGKLIILVCIVGQRVAQIIWQNRRKCTKYVCNNVIALFTASRSLLTELGARSGEKKLVYCYK